MKLNFKQRDDRQYKWESYFNPESDNFDKAWAWCWATYGQLGDRWDVHGGWLKLRSDKEYSMFVLRWS